MPRSLARERTVTLTPLSPAGRGDMEQSTCPHNAVLEWIMSIISGHR